MSEEEEDDELDLEEFAPSEWAMLMEKRFKALNEAFELMPARILESNAMKAVHALGDLLSDVCFIALDAQRKIDSLIKSGFNVEQLNDFLKPKAEEAPKKRDNIYI